MKQPRKKSTGNPGVRRKSAKRKSPIAGGVAKPGGSPSSSLLSLNSIGQLRDRTKQWLQYLQQADRVLDTLYVAGNSMSESGVLQKIIQNKGKNLSTGDLASILTALINTPVADQFFKGWGGGESTDTETKADAVQQPKQELAAPQPPAYVQPQQNQPFPYHTPPLQPQSQPHYLPYQPFSQPVFPQGFQPPGYQPQQQYATSHVNYLLAPPSFHTYPSHPVYATAPGTKKKTAK